MIKREGFPDYTTLFSGKSASHFGNGGGAGYSTASLGAAGAWPNLSQGLPPEARRPLYGTQNGAVDSFLPSAEQGAMYDRNEYLKRELLQRVKKTRETSELIGEEIVTQNKFLETFRASMEKAAASVSGTLRKVNSFASSNSTYLHIYVLFLMVIVVIIFIYFALH